MKLGLFLSLLLVLVYTDSASSLTSIRDVTETDQSPEDRKATKTYATTIADTFEGDGVAFTGLNYKKDECGCDSLSISSSSSSSNSSNSNFNAAFNLPAIIGTATGIENNETGGSLIKVYMTRFIVSGQEGESTGRALVQTKPPFSEPGPHGTLSQMIPPTPFSQSDFFSHVTFPLPKLSSEAPNPGHGTTPVGGPREIQPPPDSSSAFPKPEETQPLPAAPSVPLDSVPAPSSTRVGSPPAIESCFKSPACTSVFSHVSTCFHNLTGGYPDPLDDAKSWEYRHCFCDEYLHLVKNVESDMETCFYCLIDAGSRVIDVRTLQQDFQNFCATKWPNLYGMLNVMLLEFLTLKAPRPPVYTVIGEEIWNITSLNDVFSSRRNGSIDYNGVPGPETERPRWQSATPGTVMVNVTLTTNGTVYTTARTGFPTPLLTQVPVSWPYTGLRPTRRRNERTTWTVTSVEGGGPAGEVVARWMWWPYRRLGRR